MIDQQTIDTCREALEEWQTSISEHANIYKVPDYNAALARIDAALAQLAAEQQGGWEPVPDGWEQIDGEGYKCHVGSIAGTVVWYLTIRGANRDGVTQDAEFYFDKNEVKLFRRTPAQEDNS